jgi:hypothetical protein
MTTPIFGCIDPPHNYRLDLNHYILEQIRQQQRMSRGCANKEAAAGFRTSILNNILEKMLLVIILKRSRNLDVELTNIMAGICFI